MTKKGWTFPELLESTQYGKLFVIVKVFPNGSALVSRLHRDKTRLVAEPKKVKQWFNISVFEKQIFFVDRQGYISFFDFAPEYLNKMNKGKTNEDTTREVGISG